MFCTDIIWLHIHVTNSSIVLTLVSCCLWWRPPVSGTVPPASSSAGTPHRVSVSEDEQSHIGFPATEIDSLQQCHSNKQTSVPETIWHVQQQRGVADYTCSPLSWSPAPAARFITAGVSHAPRHEVELYTRGATSHRSLTRLTLSHWLQTLRQTKEFHTSNRMSCTEQR